VADQLSRAFYELNYKVAYLEKKGNAFQDFFSSIMEKGYTENFRRVRPWGNVGDKKNDGYLTVDSIFFQLYAPNEMSANEAISKIEEDFDGAIKQWNISKWVFVHNSMQGLGPDVSKKLDELAKLNPSVTVTHWGFEELRQEVFKLNEAELASLFGPAPTYNHINQLGFEDLIVVINSIAGKKASEDIDLKPVPPNKISANALSEDVVTLLRAGMRKANLVEDFFIKWHNPQFGDEIAEAFRKKYDDLKQNRSFTPDEVFNKLQEFAGGSQRRHPEHESAILAVLAHFFEKCDIFERPREGL
jgi:hypothetical protein